MAENLLEQPFDKFLRYTAIKNLIDVIGHDGSQGKRPILDVGGYPGDIIPFLPDSKIFILDRIDGLISNYTRGYATCLPFKKDSFDVVISSDMIEHLHSKDRILALDEMIRVSRGWVLVGFPVHARETEQCEFIINSFHKTIFSEEHPWLKEHIGYGLPNKNFLDAHLEKNNLSYATIPNGNLLNWLFMMIVNEYIHSIPDNDLVIKTINCYFNMQFTHTNEQLPVYRNIYAIHRESSMLEGLKSKLKQRKKSNSSAIDPISFLKSFDPEGLALDILQKRGIYEASLRKELAATRRHIESLEKVGLEKNNHINKLMKIIDEKQQLLTKLIDENNNKHKVIFSLEKENLKKQTAIMELIKSNEEKQAAIENLQAGIRDLQEYNKHYLHVYKERLKNTALYKYYLRFTGKEPGNK